MTKRRTSAVRVKTPLTDLENEVMRVVWTASGPCSVEAVYDVVSRHRDLKETTVRTLLRRLEPTRGPTEYR
jgi:predicted transcriptional regulator